MAIRVLNWLFVLVLLIAAFMLGLKLRLALAGYDPFIARLEMLFGVRPGQPIPVDMRAPDIRLQYMDTTPVGHGCYQVKICRYH